MQRSDVRAVMIDDMQTRVIKAEWRLDALENAQQQQAANMAALSERLDTHHREVMAAIGSLKDDRARAEGAAEARLLDAQKTRDRMKAVSLILGAIATMAALGWVNTANGAPLWLPAADAVQTPIPVRYYTRELP